MSRGNYIFNPETLEYEKVRVSKKKRMLRVILSAAGIIVLAVVVMYVLDLTDIYTPNSGLELEQKRTNKELDKIYSKVQELEKQYSDLQELDDNVYRTFLDISPVSESMRESGSGGVNKYEYLNDYSNSDLLVDLMKRVDNLNSKANVQEKSYDELLKLALLKQKKMESMPMIQPLAINDVRNFASGYGYRRHPVYKTMKMHTGIDLSARTGTPVYATGGGVVVVANYNKGGYGNNIVIDHGFGYKTRYAHLHTIGVKVGQRIKRGELIGGVGNTGTSVGSHLHYEVRVNDHPVDPTFYFFKDLDQDQYMQLVNRVAEEEKASMQPHG
ncbi:MAG: peptidoglycan DD-metalloendopeptidase family protein [Bacteroidales bacterium]